MRNGKKEMPIPNFVLLMHYFQFILLVSFIRDNMTHKNARPENLSDRRPIRIRYKKGSLVIG